MQYISRVKSLLAWLFVGCLLALQGCVSMQTVSKGNELQGYTKAYIEPLAQDEFQLYQALFSELNDMGMIVVSSPFQVPTSTDLIVRYTYDAGWDMTRYLQSFQFQFIDAKTGRIVVAQSFKSRGLWLGVRDNRLESAFNELRAKNGFPPTKQFQ